MVYHGISQQDSYCLQKLQNTACRSILKANMRAHIVDMHDDLNVATLYQRRCQHIAIQVFKFLRGIGPISCQSLLNYADSAQEITTRSSSNLTLTVPNTRLKLTDNDFTVIGPRIWNQLPIQMKALDSLETFKNEVAKFIFS